ncbi:MAG: DUF4124 domain-containing protein [Betaproteobacteria bacterium]|nr:DUF4124 domain-containing protein [Betaproteobacteria bacterium]
MNANSTIRRSTIVAGVVVAALCATSAWAQSYRCKGKDGKTYYGQIPPPQCAGQTMEMLNSQGLLIKRVEPPAPKPKLDEAAMKAAAEKSKADELAAKEEKRRDNALLDTYANEKEIELARSRALEEINRGRKEIEHRIAAAKKRQAKSKAELEFYKGGDKPPAALEAAAHSAAADIAAQENLLAHKLKEGEEISARYDEDKRRYRQLTGGK